MNYHYGMNTASRDASASVSAAATETSSQQPPSSGERVSFDDEPLILVDSENNILGYREKALCHLGEGILHRAFSIFLFDRQGRLLIHQRSAEKPLWPGFWTNSCCSHPRRGEKVVEAAHRRLDEELGLTAELTKLYDFQYQARYGDVGSENELCAVFVGPLMQEPTVNASEISAWKMIEPDALDAELQQQPDRYTPWSRMEWQRLREEFWPAVQEATSKAKI